MLQLQRTEPPGPPAPQAFELRLERFTLSGLPQPLLQEVDTWLFSALWDRCTVQSFHMRADVQGADGLPVPFLRLQFPSGQVLKCRAALLNRPFAYYAFHPGMWHAAPHVVRLFDGLIADIMRGHPAEDVAYGELSVVRPHLAWDAAAAPDAPAACVPDVEPLLQGLGMADLELSQDPCTQEVAATFRVARFLDILHMQAMACELGQMFERTAGSRREPCAADGQRSEASRRVHEEVASGRRLRQVLEELQLLTDEHTEGWQANYSRALDEARLLPSWHPTAELRRASHPASAAFDPYAMDQEESNRLLEWWLTHNEALRPGQTVDLTAFTSWLDVPLATRADVQVLCMHPGVLQLLEVTIKRTCNGASVSLVLPGCGTSVLLSCDLIRSVAATACRVNAALLQKLANIP